MAARLDLAHGLPFENPYVKAYRDVPPMGYFSPKSIDKGPILVEKVLRRGYHFTKVKGRKTP